MAISKEIQKSSEMKFDGKLIKVTYDIADVMVMKRGVRLFIILVLQLLWLLRKIIRL